MNSRCIVSVIPLCLTAAGTLFGAPAAAQSPTVNWADLERDVLSEHNLARSDPTEYARLLTGTLAMFDGRLLRRPGEIALRTEEGAAAVEEAIRFLDTTAPLDRLRMARGMVSGARDHVRDQGPKGGFGHVGSDGSQPWDRISRYGVWSGQAAENVSYGATTGRDVVMQLIVDDGVPDRGHRTNIFSPELLVMGVACGPHREYGAMCVITYATSYTDTITESGHREMVGTRDTLRLLRDLCWPPGSLE